MKYKNIIFPILALIVAVFLYFKYKVPPQIEFMKLDLTNMEGEPVSLDGYHGKNIFITMWAPWCGDCIKEMPDLQFVKEQLEKDDFVFLAISGYDIQKEKAYSERTNFDIKFLHMSDKLKDIGVHSIPTNYIINKKGKVVYQKVGAESNWRSDETIAKVRNLVD